MGQFRVAFGDGPVERRAQVVLFAQHQVHLFVIVSANRTAVCKRAVPVGMPLAQDAQLAGGFEQLLGIAANHRQQSVTRRIIFTTRDDLDKRPARPVRPALARPGRRRTRRLRRSRARHPGPSFRRIRPGVQAGGVRPVPGVRCSSPAWRAGLMPVRRAARAARQQPQWIIDPLGDLAQRQRVDPTSGQLEGEWQPIEPPADVGDEGRDRFVELEAGIDFDHPLDQQLNGVVRGNAGVRFTSVRARRVAAPARASRRARRAARCWSPGSANAGRC